MLERYQMTVLNYRQMQNVIDYLNSVCRPSSGTTYSSEMAALLKIRAISAQTNYLCNNMQINLRGEFSSSNLLSISIGLD